MKFLKKLFNFIFGRKKKKREEIVSIAPTFPSSPSRQPEDAGLYQVQAAAPAPATVVTGSVNVVTTERATPVKASEKQATGRTRRQQVEGTRRQQVEGTRAKAVASGSSAVKADTKTSSSSDDSSGFTTTAVLLATSSYDSSPSYSSSSSCSSSYDSSSSYSSSDSGSSSSSCD